MKLRSFIWQLIKLYFKEGNKPLKIGEIAKNNLNNSTLRDIDSVYHARIENEVKGFDKVSIDFITIGLSDNDNVYRGMWLSDNEQIG